MMNLVLNYFDSIQLSINKYSQPSSIYLMYRKQGIYLVPYNSYSRGSSPRINCTYFQKCSTHQYREWAGLVFELMPERTYRFQSRL